MSLVSTADLTELNFLKILSELLKSGQIDTQEAQLLSKEFLSLIPFSSYEDLQVKISNFAKKNPKFNRLNIALLTKAEEIKTNEILSKMRNFMNKDKIEEALRLSSK